MLVLLGLVATSAILGAMPGCSWIVGIQDLPDRDGGAPPPDAEPEPVELGITGVYPGIVIEGAGAAWAVPVIVTGEGFTSGVRVVLNGAGFSQREIVPVVASDGKSLAFPLRVPVLTGTDYGQIALLDVTVLRGTMEASMEMAVTGLDELVISELGATTLDAADLDPLYSRIVINQDIELTGDDLIRLVATSEIRLEGTLIADGKDGDAETPGAGGPGGCAGGALQENGGCGIGGGGGNTGDDGAGGGGHASPGTPGGGVPPSPGGAPTGRPDLVPLADEAGHGGGGAAEGAGGGGGGIVELTSYGTFVVSGLGGIAAGGGSGGLGHCSGAAVVGSAGGGSGGAILLRAWNGFDDQINAPRLSVRGGTGGDMPPDNNCMEELGGAGSFGRVRVDTATLDGVPGFADITPEPFQGPMLRNVDNAGIPVPVITTQAQITLEATGQRGVSFTLDVNGSRQSLSMSSEGRASVTVPLIPGRNQICTVISPDTPLDVSEGAQCISVVSIQ